jgi:XapX domain-containing protein
MLSTSLVAAIAAAAFGLLASIVFSWASNRSPAWNLAFGAALVLGTAAGLLAAVTIAMRWYSPR